MYARLLAFLIVSVTWTAASAAPLIIEPDDFAPGTDISNVVPGVTLSTVSSDLGDSAVFAVEPREADWASTGRLVFGHNGSFPEHWVTDTISPFRYGALRVDIDVDFDVVEVQFDLNGNDSDDIGILEAFAEDGTLLGTFETGLLDADVFETATISSATPIRYLVAGGKQADTITLDRLVLIPEPASLALFLFGGLLWRRGS